MDGKVGTGDGGHGDVSEASVGEKLTCLQPHVHKN